MLVQIAGSVVDGPIPPTVRIDRGAPLMIWQRTTVTVEVTVRYVTGPLVPASRITSGRMTVRPRTANGAVLLTKTAAIGAGLLTFSISETDVTDQKFPAGDYMYDVLLVTSDGARNVVVPASILRVERSLATS